MGLFGRKAPALVGDLSAAQTWPGLPEARTAGRAGGN
jgi:hypothetical protein